jgi:hypothetical protein
MENYYKRIEIKSVNDLPKNEGVYIFGWDKPETNVCFGISRENYSPADDAETQTELVEDYDWYLQPITSEEYQKQVEFEAACNPDLIEAQTNYMLYQEKIEALEELVEWLDSECPKVAPPLEPYTTADFSHDFAEKLRTRLDDICSEPESVEPDKTAEEILSKWMDKDMSYSKSALGAMNEFANQFKTK